MKTLSTIALLASLLVAAITPVQAQVIIACDENGDCQPVILI